jgi:hypothetical protein
LRKKITKEVLSREEYIKLTRKLDTFGMEELFDKVVQLGKGHGGFPTSPEVFAITKCRLKLRRNT